MAVKSMVTREEMNTAIIKAVQGARRQWCKNPDMIPDCYVPKGFALVPVEPTIAMLDAGEKEHRTTTLYSRNNVRNIYKAMIEAAE